MWIEIVNKAGQQHTVNSDHIVQIVDATSIGGMSAPGGRSIRVYMVDGKEILIDGINEVRAFRKILDQVIHPGDSEEVSGG